MKYSCYRVHKILIYSWDIFDRLILKVKINKNVDWSSFIKLRAIKICINEEKHALSNANLNITFNEYINIFYVINSSKKIELYIIKSETHCLSK